MRINNNVVKEFSDLLNMKKRNKTQNARIREIWAAMRELPAGSYSTSSFSYLVSVRKGGRKRKTHKAVFLRLLPSNVQQIKKVA